MYTPEFRIARHAKLLSELFNRQEIQTVTSGAINNYVRVPAPRESVQCQIAMSDRDLILPLSNIPQYESGELSLEEHRSHMRSRVV